MGQAKEILTSFASRYGTCASGSRRCSTATGPKAKLCSPTALSTPRPRNSPRSFGGSELTDLYFTTSREGLAECEDPLAGALFRASVGVIGQPTREFAG